MKSRLCQQDAEAVTHSLPPTKHNVNSNFQNIKFTLTVIFSKPILGVLKNSAYTERRPFQANINCSKYIIDALQQHCNTTLLVSLLLTSIDLFFVLCYFGKSL